MTITELLRYLHIPGNYAGFRQLHMAVEIAVSDENALLNICRDIYDEIARRTDSNPKAVEKNIRTVISIAWMRGCNARLSQLAGFAIDVKPGTGEFLDIISSYLRVHAAEEVTM